MANFKNKIWNTLKNENKTDATFKYLSNIQNNLIKNYSNPVFLNSDKNKLLEKYSKIKNIGEAIYKFKTLKQNNLNAEAQNEKENTSNLVLKGGISNYKYVWHSENSDTTCDECSDLNGQEFDFEDEVPERPHPNCKCTVEIVEYNDENEKPDDEQKICEDSIAIEEMLAESEDIHAEADSLNNEANEEENEVNFLLSEIQEFSIQVENARDELIEMIEDMGDLAADLRNYFADLYSLIDIFIILKYGQEVLYILKEIYASFGIFEDYYEQLQALSAAGLCEECTDKFQHANANYDCTTRGTIAEITAMLLSVLKEIRDLIIKVPSPKFTFKQAWDDCMKDLRADWYGIQKAKEQINSAKNLSMDEIREIFCPKK